MRTIIEMIAYFIAFMIVTAIGLFMTWLVLLLVRAVLGVF